MVVQKRKRVKITAKFQDIEEIIIVYIKKILERGLPITGPALRDLVGQDSVLPKDGYMLLRIDMASLGKTTFG